MFSVTIVSVYFLWDHCGGQIAETTEWIAVIQWSIETFPQLWLNQNRGSTDGQAIQSVAVSFLGKTTDFVSMVCLDLPLQLRIMIYFSTSSAYVNVMQYLHFQGLKLS